MSIYQRGMKYKEEVKYDRERYKRDGGIIMNPKYRQGVMFEYEVRNWLEEKGWLVIRSAGSKSPIDLVAVRQNQTLLVQCKKGTKPPRAERKTLSLLEGKTGKNIQVLIAYKRKFARNIEWYTMREDGEISRVYI
jgi:Holliday junction resolvase-like predicted endonuclease